MPRIYSPNPLHSCDYGVDFYNGAAAVPTASTGLIAWFTAKGYTIIQGSDTLAPWDYLTKEQVIEFAKYCGVTATGTKQEMITLIEADVFSVAKYEITAFDAIANKSAGTVAAPVYADATAVKAALPTRVIATLSGGMVASIPVTAWVDTDTFNKAAAGSYTFTATLGTIPKPYANTAAVTATIEVVVSA
jgi:hypothetical protein